MPPKDQPTPAPNPAARQFTAYPSRTDYFAYAYAALVFFGGIMGFLKAGSLTSLYMGAGAGTVLGYGARLASVDRRRVEVLFGVSAVLMISMGNRFAKNPVWWPTGFVSLASAISFARYGLRLANN